MKRPPDDAESGPVPDQPFDRGAVVDFAHSPQAAIIIDALACYLAQQAVERARDPPRKCEKAP